MELLVVVAILALLVAMLVPTLTQARLMAKRAACMASLSALGKAAATYEEVWKVMVPVCWKNEPLGITNPWPCWREALLPYSPSVSVFSCPAAKDSGTIGETIHSEAELASRDPSHCGTCNVGSYGLVFIAVQPTYKATNCYGLFKPANMEEMIAFPTQLGVVWKDPNNSVYAADGFIVSSGVNTAMETDGTKGTSHIYMPSDTRYFHPEPNHATRRFGDRHLGTNCLFLGGNVKTFATADLESMTAGAPDCVWDAQ